VSGPPAEPATRSPASRRHAGCSSILPRKPVSLGSRRAALLSAHEARRSLHRDPLAGVEHVVPRDLVMIEQFIE
jgi:hypothetical protein